MAKVINGIGASNGIAIGRAFIYKQDPKIYTSENRAEVSNEVKRIEIAKIKAFTELNNLIIEVKDKIGESEAEILKTQLAFLDDPAFLPEAIDIVRDKKCTAEKAIEEVVNMLYSIFLDINDEYMRERAIDIKDLGKRIIEILSGVSRFSVADIKEEIILISNDLTPSETVQLNKEFIKAFITKNGGKTSHTAILAKSIEIPAVVGIGDSIKNIKENDIVIVDGSKGICIINPDESTINSYKQRKEIELKESQRLKEYVNKPAKTIDGIEIKLVANINKPNDATIALQNGAEGIGLYRTEFLFINNDHLPSEEEQYQVYKEIALTMANKPVIFRTFDIGGDKELSYFKLPNEANPFLGYRATRLAMEYKEIFITQLRAILRASINGNFKIMFPMISSIEEWRIAKNLYDEAKNELLNEGIMFNGSIELGVMVEIPSVALLADQFANEVDFFSIGTNDLVQYTLAVDRMNERVAHLYDYFNPAVLYLIKRTVEASHKKGKWTGMCGGMAGDPLAVPVLLGFGLDELSMDPNSINAVKQTISKLKHSECITLANEIISLSSAEEVRERLSRFHNYL